MRSKAAFGSTFGSDASRPSTTVRRISRARLQQVCHHRRQAIVVSKPDLRHAHGVVLIHDRQAVPLQERQDSVADVQISSPVSKSLAVKVSGPCLCRDLPGTPDTPASRGPVPRRRGLQSPQIAGCRLSFSWPNPAPMAPELDQDHFSSRTPGGLHLVGQSFHPARVQDAVRPGDHVGADLDYHRMGQRDDLLADGIDHRGELYSSQIVEQADISAALC